MKDQVGEIVSEVDSTLEPLGFESHPFLVGWYNEQVDPKFRLSFPDSTLSVVVISKPSMFEAAFLPFLSDDWEGVGKSLRDPLDECMLHTFSKVTQKFPEATAMHDFQLGQFRRPKVLVQTAGHVSGCVRYYHPSAYPSLALPSGVPKLFPVCHHSKYGGWFALRGVIIFPSVSAPQLQKVQPPPSLSEEEAKQLLVLYNTSWQDNRWRDVGRLEGDEFRYSDQQILYFNTKPAERSSVIEELLSKCLV